MKHTTTLLFLMFALFSFPSIASAQVAKTQVVQLSAIANSDGTITLKWPKETYAGNFKVYHRNFVHNNNVWSAVDATLAGTVNTWTDATATAGTDREYLVTKVNGTTTEAFGYIYAGNKFIPKADKGGIILLIDSSYLKALSKEINTLYTDLYSSGYFPTIIFAGRKEKAEAVKTKIKAFVDKAVIRPKAIYIVGHVPVPYSGYFSSNGDRPPPDGHVEGSGNHTGAWPADLYYGELEGFWSDQTVNCTTAGDPRNYNIPNDGKFDQSTVDNPVELEVGRIDMFGMDQFSKNDTLLVKEYLNRVHNFRMGNLSFRRRGLIDNNFTGLNLASTGYQNIPCFVGLDSFSDAVDYFTEQNAGSYLWSYGCGAGSYNSCNGIGTTSDFVANKGKFNNAFTMMAGSFFGDWDSKNNLLRASLASGSLACCWGGIPKWYLHHMAMGVNIGYGAKITQNNANDYFNGNFNGAWNGVFIALMGDPTLTMLQVAPPSNLSIAENQGTTLLKWNASKEKVDGYAVYRIDESKQEWREISSYCPSSANTTTDTFYLDYCKSTPLGNNQGKYTYAVRAFRWETTGAGSYRNLSMGVVGQTITTDVNSINQTTILAYPNPTHGEIVISGLKGSNRCDLRIVNISGQVLKSVSGSTSESGEIHVNVADLSDQLLLIQVNQGDKFFTEKVNLTHN
jgi:hypothetical protein